LKNDIEQVSPLIDQFDFANDEECVEYNECDVLLPFIKSGEAVLEVEYSLPTQSFCPRLRALGFSAMRKTESLDARCWPC
jgi:hypothetical protein